MQSIYIVRHGQSQKNAHKIVAGSQESPLTELGKKQAELTGKKIAHLGIDLIVASNMERAQQTATIIAKQIGYPVAAIRTMPELRERNLGALEGHIYAKNPRLNGNFPSVDHITGVEPLAQFYSRVQHGLRQLLADDHSRILVVCHMGPGRMLQTIAANQEPRMMYRMPLLENGGIYSLHPDK